MYESQVCSPTLMIHPTIAIVQYDYDISDHSEGPVSRFPLGSIGLVSDLTESILAFPCQAVLEISYLTNRKLRNSATRGNNYNLISFNDTPCF